MTLTLIQMIELKW